MSKEELVQQFGFLCFTVLKIIVSRELLLSHNNILASVVDPDPDPVDPNLIGLLDRIRIQKFWITDMDPDPATDPYCLSQIWRNFWKTLNILSFCYTTYLTTYYFSLGTKKSRQEPDPARSEINLLPGSGSGSVSQNYDSADRIRKNIDETATMILTLSLLATREDMSFLSTCLLVEKSPKPQVGPLRKHLGPGCARLLHLGSRLCSVNLRGYKEMSAIFADQ